MTEVNKYNHYKRNIKYMLLITGVWPGFQNKQHPFSTFSIICVILSTSWTIYGIVAYCLQSFNNINVLVKGLGLVFTFSSCFLKVSMMAIHKRDMVCLNRGISTLFEKDLENQQNRQHLLAHLSVFRNFFYYLNVTVGANVGLMVFAPLLALPHGKYLRAYPQAFPFSYEPGGLIHWCLYAVEVVSGFYLYIMTVGADTVFGYYALHIVGELRLLSSRFEKLTFDKDYKKNLKECIDRHILIFESHRILQRVFGILAIWLAISCAIIMCAIIFQSTEMQHMTVYRAFYLIFYCLLKLGQAYTYAWYGNIITVESEICLDAIYNSNWSDSGNLRVMNDVLIIQTQNPFIFKAKDCVFIRLDLFSKILQTSVSYFFLLRSLDERL